MEFIDEALEDRRYLSGKQFLNQLSFLGCAPNIVFKPEQGEHFLRIDIPQLTAPTLFLGERTKPVICPQCKQIIDDWASQLSQGRYATCPHCKAVSPPTQLNFRRKACFTQHIIRISPIFESEAVPNKTLLDQLKSRLDLQFYFAYL